MSEHPDQQPAQDQQEPQIESKPQLTIDTSLPEPISPQKLPR